MASGWTETGQPANRATVRWIPMPRPIATAPPVIAYFMFPYDMSPVIRLKSGEYAWICCAIQGAIKRAPGGVIPVKGPSPEPPAKSMGYKPFADFFGGKVEDYDAK